MDEWNAFLKETNADLDARDVGAPLAGPLAVKDEEEIVRQVYRSQRVYRVLHLLTFSRLDS